MKEWDLQLFSKVVVVWAVFSCATTAMAAGLGSYNGTWWVNLSVPQKVTFLEGENDCYIYDVRGPHYASQFDKESVSKVDKYYSTHPNSVSRDVLDVFRMTFGATSNQNKKAGSGEHYPEKHGIFNGDFWLQVGSAARPYFVMGYLSCSVKYLHKRFDHDIPFYVESIDARYGIKDDEDIGNDAHFEDKVGDILDHLLRAGAHQPHS